MKNLRWQVLLTLLMALFFTFVSPELQVTGQEHGGEDLITVNIGFVSPVLADGADPEPKPDPKPNPKSDPKPQPANKGDDDDDDDDDDGDPDPEPKPDPKPEPKKKTHHEPKDSDPGFDPNNYVSKEDYQELQKQVADLTQKNKDRVISARIEHAKKEEYIASDDKEAESKLRKIAANDEAWESYLEVAKPNVPDHIAHQRFQSKNLKSTKHVEDQGILDKVLEHQKAS